jgi:SAM-dependent methyltransferase
VHRFADREAAEEVLATLAARPEPLVRELPRQRGQHDSRWAHLLGDAPVEQAAVAEPGQHVDRESVLAQGAQARDDRVRSSYDAVATPYAERLADELAGLPFEGWLLDRVAAHAAGGPVVEVGCGPGHVTAYLAEAGADATGVDLSPAMVAEARRRFPDGDYQVGDLRRLMRPTSAPGWSAVLAWYSLIHLAASELPGALESLIRPLATGGWLVVALHAGNEVRHNGSWFDLEVDLDFVFHEAAEIVALAEAAGLVEVEWYVRGPMTSRGETSQRLYVVGRKPG